LFLKSDSETVITKGEKHLNYEFAVNIGVAEVRAEQECFGLILMGEDDRIFQRYIVRRSSNYSFYLDTGDSKIILPDGFNPINYHQFRFLKTGERTVLQLEDKVLLEMPGTDTRSRVAIFCENAVVALDMVRLTVL
jgi:hypothetical protein